VKLRPLILFFFFLLIAKDQFARAGGCISSCGGDFTVQAFQDMTSDVLDSLERLEEEGALRNLPIKYKSHDGGPIDTNATITFEQNQTAGDKLDNKKGVLRIQASVKDLRASYRRVDLRDGKLLIDGNEVDFRNHPKDGNVDLTEDGWNKEKDLEKRRRMVIHELLMLAKASNETRNKHVADATSINSDIYDDYRYDEQLSRKLADLVSAEIERNEQPNEHLLHPCSKPREAAEKNIKQEKNLGNIKAAVEAAKQELIPTDSEIGQIGRFCLLLHESNESVGVLNSVTPYSAEGPDTPEKYHTVLVDRCKIDHPDAIASCYSASFRCGETTADRKSWICVHKGVWKWSPEISINGTSLEETELRLAEKCLKEKFENFRCVNIALAHLYSECQYYSPYSYH
jgi:hypothetical protein